jgi:uncharacterized membrane protein
MSDNPAPSSDADVQPTAFHKGSDEVGQYPSSSTQAVMINRPRQALYDYWRDFRNLPNFMPNVKSVEMLESGRSHWVVSGPAGTEVEWTSEVTEDDPGRRIAWRSTEGAEIDNEGWIEFRDNAFGRGTEVRVFISYDPPGGALGKIAAKVMQREPRIQARRELRRFKQLMETGEIPTSKAPDAAPRS